MDNQKISEIFQEIGDILEIKGENRFKILAYQNAAMKIADLGQDLKDIYLQNPDELEKIPGIGKDLRAKIVEMIETGKCSYHDELLKTFPSGLLDMLRVRSVGPKKVKLFYGELGIDSVEKLKSAAENGELQNLPRMGEKSEHEILTAIGEYEKHSERMLLSHALEQAEELIEHMKKCKEVGRVEYAGSLRRMKETIGDIDILVTMIGSQKKNEKIMDHFAKFPPVKNVIARGSTKSSVILESGVQVDLRVIDHKVFGAAMHYFTGSKDHNIAIRDRAKKMGLKVSEYGVFDKKEKLVAGRTEESLFKAVGLPFIEPLLRENRGEIEAAEMGELPLTVELSDLKGDLHVHSNWSDGSQEIGEIARFYRDHGFEYIALTDHSTAMAVAHGLTPERFEMQWDEIDEVNKELEKEAAKKGAFRILKGVECDIKGDGTMDLPDSILKKMDVVVASVHLKFSLSEKEQTERIVRALENPYVTILGHPSGRLINQREPYAVDMSKVIDAAIKNNVILEINSQPSRLDLQDFYCKLAKDRGAKFSIDTDSHHTSQIANLELGVAVAKRGWLEDVDVVNCLGFLDLLKVIGR